MHRGSRSSLCAPTRLPRTSIHTSHLGATWESIARWTPVGAVMTLFAGVLNLNSWTSSDLLSVVACLGYIVVCAAIGIRWFQWEAR